MLKDKEPRPPTVPLSDLKKGQKGTVECLLPHKKKDLQKYLILGLVPGESILVLHHNPLYVIQVGHTQIALDQEGASAIFVSLN
jgi:Fe2+ transport system protein FeoA